jgi:hypothetical protein
VFKEESHAAIISACTGATATIEGAAKFLPGLPHLLSVDLEKPELRFRNMTAAYSTLIRQLVEDPYLTQTTFEIAIRSALVKPIPLEQFMTNFGPQLKRAREQFKRACENCTNVVKKDDENFCMIEEKP